LNPRGPSHRHTVAGAAEVGGHLFGPLVGCVEGPSPAHGIVRVGLVRAPDIIGLHVLLHGRKYAIRNGHFAVKAIDRTFGTGPVVATNVDDECVIELPGVPTTRSGAYRDLWASRIVHRAVFNSLNGCIVAIAEEVPAPIEKPNSFDKELCRISAALTVNTRFE